MPINLCEISFPIDTGTIAFARIIALVVEAIKNVYNAPKNIEYFSSNLRPARFPDLQIFVEIVCINLQSPVWSRHVGVPPRNTNMAAVKWCKHLELTLAI